jgi:hypothetical protein
MNTGPSKRNELTLIYTACFLASLPALAVALYLGWIGADMISVALEDQVNHTPETFIASIVLAVLAIVLSLGFYYILSGLLAPIGVLIFLRKSTDIRKTTAGWLFVLLLLAPLPAFLSLLGDIFFIGFGISILWGISAPYVAWKLATKKRLQYRASIPAVR